MNKENAYKVPSYYWFPCHFYPFSPIDYNGLNTFSNILSLSPSIKLELEKTFPNKNIYYLPHIVQKQPITMTKEEIRNKWNIPNDKYVVLIVCNLIDEYADKYIVNRKGIDAQLIAFKQFNEKYKNSLLFIHSTKYKYDNSLYPLGDLICKLEFTQDNFFWNKNILSEIELHELYKMSDILLNCTKSEGFGVPILEAQYYNINVITNHFTSMKEHNFQDNVVEPSTSSLNYGVSGIWITPSSFNIFEMMEQIYLNNSNNIIKQKRSNWIVNKLTNYTNIKNKLKKILQIE
jgi:glycosyltransferase involved in cell wall biosynthesis